MELSSPYGVFRVPKGYFKKMKQLYPQEAIFNIGLETDDGMVSYRQEIAEKCIDLVAEQCLEYVDDTRLFKQS